MTRQQKLLTYVVGLVAAALLQWPSGPLVLFLIADVNGDIHTKVEV